MMVFPLSFDPANAEFLEGEVMDMEDIMDEMGVDLGPMMYGGEAAAAAGGLAGSVPPPAPYFNWPGLAFQPPPVPGGGAAPPLPPPPPAAAAGGAQPRVFL